MAADVLTTLVTSLGNNFASPITLAINLILSTIIGGVVLLVLVEVFGKKFKEKVHPANAFLVVLIINIVNLLGIMALISPFISFIPMVTWIAPALIWIILIKLFFKEMKFTHAILVGIVGFVLSIFLIPSLIGMASSFVPAFK
jgi:LytS/YehU family sensor histidine kinase